MIRYTLTLLALGMACAASAQLPFRYVTVSEAEINNFQGSLDLIDTYKSYLLAEHPEHGSDWNFYTSNEGNGYFVFSYANLAAFEAARDAQKAADGAFWQGMMADSARASKFMNADRLWDWTRAELYELMELADRGRVKLSMSEYKLSEANKALHDLNDGNVKGRAVLVP